MKMTATRLQQAAQLAATMSTNLNSGVSHGVLASPLQEAQICLQALRLLHTMEWVAGLVEGDETLLDCDTQESHIRIAKLVRDRDAEPVEDDTVDADKEVEDDTVDADKEEE